MGTHKPIYIFKDTTIILGAGAHVPYDFPTAEGLTELIKNLRDNSEYLYDLDGKLDYMHTLSNDSLQDKQNICRLMRNLKLIYTSVPVNSLEYDLEFVKYLDLFVDEFAESQVNSIDTFLSQKKLLNPKDQNKINVGKLIIAYFIKKSEDAVRIGYHKKDWIRYITDEFLRHERLKDDFFENPPKIFTFNYDNFFEKSIYKHLRSMHGLEHSAAYDLVKKINITHIYGDINSIDYLDADGDLDESYYLQAIGRIRVAGEERADEKNKIADRILSSVGPCTQVFFLGFSFDDLNVKKLFADADFRESYSFSGTTQFVSTHVGLTSKEKIDIQNKLPFSLYFPRENECNCLELIREEYPIFQFTAFCKPVSKDMERIDRHDEVFVDDFEE